MKDRATTCKPLTIISPEQGQDPCVASGAREGHRELQMSRNSSWVQRSWRQAPQRWRVLSGRPAFE